MSQLTTYRANGKSIGLIFLFKYDLDGDLRLFEIVEGKLDGAQMSWLYSGNFPATEMIMKDNWCKLEKYKKVFQIEKALPDLSFAALWDKYNHKVNRIDAEKAYKKTKEADLIKCFISLPAYEKYLSRSGVGKLHLSRYILKRRFEDDFTKA